MSFHKLFTARRRKRRPGAAIVNVVIPMTRMKALALLIAASGYALAQTPIINQISNGASFAQDFPVTGGSLISIFGSNLSSRTAQADSIPLSTSLGGVTVHFVNGSTTMDGPMLYVQPNQTGAQSQINVQVPWNIVTAGTTSTVNVVVSQGGTSSAPTPVTVGPFSPGIFAADGFGIIQNSSDSTLAWPSGTIPGLLTHAAKAGDIVVIYATGLGAVDVPVADGQNSLDAKRTALTQPIVMIGGLTAQVQFAGLSPQFVGVNQLNVVVPNAVPGSQVPVQIQVGGLNSAPVFMAITQ